MENSSTDSSQIREALQNLYFKGIYEEDTGLLKLVYYPRTLLFRDVNGLLYSTTLDHYLNRVKTG